MDQGHFEAIDLVMYYLALLGSRTADPNTSMILVLCLNAIVSAVISSKLVL